MVIQMKDQFFVMCCESIASIYEKLQLGSMLNNQPLFVSELRRVLKIGRIFVDGGSVVNIMMKSTLRQLRITMDELSKSCLTIQVFK